MVLTDLQSLKPHFSQRTCTNRDTLWCSASIQLSDQDMAIVRPFEENGKDAFFMSTKCLLGTGVTLTRAFRSMNLDAFWEE